MPDIQHIVSGVQIILRLWSSTMAAFVKLTPAGRQRIILIPQGIKCMPLLKKLTGVAPGQDVAFVPRAVRRTIEFCTSNESRVS
jgi:hypothetical protein